MFLSISWEIIVYLLLRVFNQNVANNTASLLPVNIFVYQVLDLVVLGLSIFTLIFTIFMLRDILNQYIFMSLVGIILSVIWLVLLFNYTYILILGLDIVLSLAVVLTAILVIAIDLFVLYKAYTISTKAKKLSSYVDTIIVAYKGLLSDIDVLNKNINRLNEKLEPVLQELRNKIPEIEIIKIYEW